MIDKEIQEHTTSTERQHADNSDTKGAYTLPQ